MLGHVRGLCVVAAAVVVGAMGVPGFGQERDWPPLLGRLGSNDIQVREAAQLELDRTSSDELESLMRIAGGNLNMEVAARVQRRIVDMTTERIARHAASVPARRFQITGRVVDRAGVPLAGVPISAGMVELVQLLPAARSGPDGRFTLDVPFDNVLYRVGGNTSLAFERPTVVPDARRDAGDVIYGGNAEQETVQGTLVDTERRPVANQDVVIYGSAGSVAALRTDAAGAFRGRIHGLRETGPGVMVVVRRGPEAVPIQMGMGRNGTALQLQLARAGTVEGTVFGAGGKPFANARVTARISPSGLVNDFKLETVTDANGHYRFTGLPAATNRRSTYLMTADAPGWTMNSYSDTGVLESGGTLSKDITMERVPVVVGRVVNHQGRPVKGALVGLARESAQWWSDLRGPWNYIESDDQGRFVLGGEPSGVEMAVVAYFPEEGLVRVPLGPLKAGDMFQKELRLPGAVRVRGTVAGESGEPVMGVMCTIAGAREAAGVPDERGRFDFGQLSLGSAEHPASVTFNAPRPIRMAVDRFSAGAGRAAVAFTGRGDAPAFYQHKVVPLTRRPGDVTELKVVLPRAQLLEFTGVVVDKQEKPVAGASVYLLTGEAHAETWLYNQTLRDRQGNPVSGPRILSWEV